MIVDITFKITQNIFTDIGCNEDKVLPGHLGTHFDVMDKEFPLQYTERKAVVFDVSAVCERDIGIKDIDLTQVKNDMFVAFSTGFIEKEKYGSKKYFKEHPQLSNDLIEKLLERKISIIGIDFAGVRRGPEHQIKDQHCADRNVFIVENLCNLKSLLGNESSRAFTANTYPMNYSGVTGLPCRVTGRL